MLRVTLHINSERIADYEIRNTGPALAALHLYEVRPIINDTAGDLLLRVPHNRDDGAHTLAATVLRALAGDGWGGGAVSRDDLRAQVLALDDEREVRCRQTGDSAPCTCHEVVIAVLALIDAAPRPRPRRPPMAAGAPSEKPGGIR